MKMNYVSNIGRRVNMFGKASRCWNLCIVSGPWSESWSESMEGSWSWFRPTWNSHDWTRVTIITLVRQNRQ
jgi:hypothetical protein